MKNIFLFAVLFAFLSACTKSQLDDSQIALGSSDPASFRKGESVTLTVSAPDSQTKVDGSMNVSGEVDFTWNVGDQIKVTVGGASSTFTLLSGSGSSQACFVGKMPADGSSFDVQYPVDTPDLSTQNYIANALPKDKMLATKTGCTMNTPVSLEPQYSVMRIKLWAASKQVGKIVITNTTSDDDPKPSYTLNCGTGVSLSTDSAAPTSFLVVVDPGTYQFEAEVTSAISYGCMKVSTAGTKTIEKGKVLNMATKQAILTTGSDPSHAQ